METNKNLNSKRIGITCIIISAFCFSLMSLFVRLAGDLPTMQKALFRNLVAAFVAAALLIKSGEKVSLDRRLFPDLALRCGFGTIGLIANFYAIDHLNISDANMLNKLSPFFAVLMSIFILGEKAKTYDWIAIVLAFSGALLVIKPGFSLASGAALIGLSSGFFAGVAYTFVRKLGKQGMRGPVIVFVFSTFSTLVCLPFYIMDYQPMSMAQTLCLFMAGISAAGAQLAITKAYTYAPAKEISVYDYTQVIFAAIWGFFAFHQIPDVFSFLGYAIIIAAAILRWNHDRKAQ